MDQNKGFSYIVYIDKKGLCEQHFYTISKGKMLVKITQGADSQDDISEIIKECDLEQTRRVIDANCDKLHYEKH